jgi:hypothetical protein
MRQIGPARCALSVLVYDRQITLRRLAELTKEQGHYVPFQRLSEISTGRWLPRPEQIKVLLKVLGCQLSDLYPDPAVSQLLSDYAAA